MVNHPNRPTNPDHKCLMGFTAQQGVRDFLAQTPYPREYDTWSKVAQANYENGRLHAANMKLAGLQPPLFINRDNYQSQWRALRLQAIEAVGNATPGSIT